MLKFGSVQCENIASSNVIIMKVGNVSRFVDASEPVSHNVSVMRTFCTWDLVETAISYASRVEPRQRRRTKVALFFQSDAGLCSGRRHSFSKEEEENLC